MNSFPTQLEKSESGDLVIDWSDGSTRRYRPRELRDKCPCATCREKRSAPPPPATSLPLLTPEEIAPLAIASMKPIGNYAYGIAFSDGHHSGLFTLDLLRELGEAATGDAD
jgi:DUF971 family protein